MLAKCHDVRNRGEYEGDLDVDERLVADLMAACQAVASLRPSLHIRQDLVPEEFIRHYEGLAHLIASVDEFPPLTSETRQEVIATRSRVVSPAEARQ